MTPVRSVKSWWPNYRKRITGCLHCSNGPPHRAELVVIKELLGHAHIGVTATVYANVRLRPQRDAIDTLSTALGSPGNPKTARSDGDEPPPCAAPVR
ncbi:hypothetical protein [Streptomyces sp. NPDC056291]|uniref:hypothetical protein n=1 Tax=Streptomyces sp. NPDC056291 TaxID=3345772 RepID=UPI0035D55CDC